MATIRLSVNGKARSVDTEPERPLLEVLREDLGLTGTKYGCGEGQCGSCTVLLDGKPAVSCVTTVRAAEGRKIVTIEGLAAGGELAPVQQGVFDEGAVQCGYCTPGMVLQTMALLENHPKPTDAQIVDGLNGHLCRCSDYQRIMAAVRRAPGSAGKKGQKGGMSTVNSGEFLEIAGAGLLIVAAAPLADARRGGGGGAGGAGT